MMAPCSDARVVHRRLPRAWSADHILPIIVRVSQGCSCEHAVWWM